MDTFLQGFKLRLRRSSSVRQAYSRFTKAKLPVPRAVRPVGRMFYDFLCAIGFVLKRFKSLIYSQPLFECQCEQVGARLSLVECPAVHGNPSIVIGDDLNVSGSLFITSGRIFDRPSLRIGNRVFIGHDVTISCNREVVIEDDVLIAAKCRISDNDGHPILLPERLAGLPQTRDSILPVRICRGAWIGAGTFILKGVTIGEGCVVGANCVVTRDLPAFTVVAAAPATIVNRTAVA
jgi:acetyltransferase-like isoleucine patch superfamily enzyme